MCGLVAGAKLTEVKILDRDYLMVTYIEGDVFFKDDAKGPNAFTDRFSKEDNWVVHYGQLDIEKCTKPLNWEITSKEDPSYIKGKNPVIIFRKSKIHGMAQLEWDNSLRDWKIDTPLEHTLYLKLPSSLLQGKSYKLSISSEIDKTKSVIDIVFDIFKSRSEAIHLNLIGFMEGDSLKSADIYHWLGDGKARDYSSFEGAKVWVFEPLSGIKYEVEPLKFFTKRNSDVGGHDLTVSDVWITDFSKIKKPGIYRLVVEGIGSSQDFEIKKQLYAEPFKVSVKGFYYMRIGEEIRSNIKPVPRQPRFIPNKDPEGFKVIITTMQPYHPEWKTFSHGDVWDRPNDWARFAKKGNPENPNAFGGHSDALDWDRHLGHVSIIYDMLFPFILTEGKLSDDDTGIAESYNGIPDLLDEARNEVDFWLRLRDGEGYSHGLTNPTKDNIMYQAGTTVIAAWANAANCAMLSYCFQIAGLEELKKEYLKHALKAWNYAVKQRDQQLDKIQNVGDCIMYGRDFKITAAVYLFNLTGEKRYENVIKDLSLATTDTSDIGSNKTGNQIWAAAGYILSPQKISYPELQERMKRCILYHAKLQEYSQSFLRPSRRSTDNATGWFHTSQNVHRSILAHKISTDKKEKETILNALILEADFGLGRNPLNMIQMTTATTFLERYRSVENAYTSGRNDGTPGLHPGHTPYLNGENWGGNMVGSNPRKLAQRGYPEYSEWPKGEIYFNTRWVWAHSEFTPQQTMRGKMALYGYLYGIDKY